MPIYSASECIMLGQQVVLPALGYQVRKCKELSNGNIILVRRDDPNSAFIRFLNLTKGRFSNSVLNYTSKTIYHYLSFEGNSTSIPRSSWLTICENSSTYKEHLITVLTSQLVIICDEKHGYELI